MPVVDKVSILQLGDPEAESHAQGFCTPSERVQFYSCICRSSDFSISYCLSIVFFFSKDFTFPFSPKAFWYIVVYFSCGSF